MKQRDYTLRMYRTSVSLIDANITIARCGTKIASEIGWWIRLIVPSISSWWLCFWIILPCRSNIGLGLIEAELSFLDLQNDFKWGIFGYQSAHMVQVVTNPGPNKVSHLRVSREEALLSCLRLLYLIKHNIILYCNWWNANMVVIIYKVLWV